MFDITSSKLLLLGIVALLVIGPKDFPALLRTIGKYIGIVRGHAKEFRAQFDEAMRESEIADLKKDVENIARETEATLQSTGQTVESSLSEVRHGIDTSLKPTPDPLAHDADGLPIPTPLPLPAIEPAHELNGAAHAETPANRSANTVGETAAEQTRPAEKSGA